MRIYIPASATDLTASDLQPSQVHGVTPALRAALPGEDDEVLELVALLAAADESVQLLAGRGDAPRRVVLAADVPDDALRSAPEEAIETALIPVEPIPWSRVVSLHVDEEEAAAEIAAAAAGDADAFERSGERDLLWFDVTERGQVARDLLGA